LKNNSLEEIRQLVYHGHFIESKALLSKLKYDLLPIEEKIQFEILSYKTLNGLHDYETVLKEIDSTIEIIRLSNMVSELLQILYIKSYALLLRNRLDESLIASKEGLKLIKDMSKKRQQQVSIERAYLNLQMGFIYFSMKLFKKALLYARRSLKIFEVLNSHVGIGSHLNYWV
jgi:tetratricopeptide (TPR) repeat protein